MNLQAWVKTTSPLAERFSDCRPEHIAGKVIAGVIVAIMLVPQAMASGLFQCILK